MAQATDYPVDLMPPRAARRLLGRQAPIPELYLLKLLQIFRLTAQAASRELYGVPYHRLDVEQRTEAAMPFFEEYPWLADIPEFTDLLDGVIEHSYREECLDTAPHALRFK